MLVFDWLEYLMDEFTVGLCFVTYCLLCYLPLSIAVRLLLYSLRLLK